MGVASFETGAWWQAAHPRLVIRMTNKRKQPATPSPVTNGPLPRSGVAMGMAGPLDPTVAVANAVAAARAERVWAGWQRPLLKAQASPPVPLSLKTAATTQGERFEASTDGLLTQRTTALLQALAPSIATAAAEVQAVLERVPVGDEEALASALEVECEQALGRVNDRLVELLGADLVDGAPGLWQAAAELLAANISLPRELTPAQALASVDMVGESVASWLRRASPSRWMLSLLEQLGNAVRRGWEGATSAKATAQAAAAAFVKQVEKAATDVVESALWNQRDQQLVDAAAAAGITGPWRWVTRIDERTCDTCGPLHGKVVPTRELLPACPLHPRCRCTCTPLPAQLPGGDQ
jgi:SPP1 gp7 family putative phage head morphogenesis protein